MSSVTRATGSAPGLTIRAPGSPPTPPQQDVGFPVIAGISPQSGLPGDGVVLSGQGLAFTNAVAFSNAQGLTGASFVVFSDFTVMAFVPNLAPGPASVFVTTAPPAGVQAASNSVAFQVLKPVTPPTLDPTDPFEPKGAAVGQGVIINGKNLAQVTDVYFNGTKAAPPTTVGRGMLMAIVPNGATTGPIRIVAPSGEATSSTNFVVVTAPPQITNIVPDLAQPGTTVEIQGRQLLAATVTFGGIKAKVPVKKERRLEAVVPQLPPGPVTVVATNALGQATFPFTVT